MITLARKKFLLSVPLAAALLLGLVGWWSHNAVRRTVETKLRAELGTVLDANVTALEIWVRNQERVTGLLANDPEVRELAVQLLTNPPSRESPRAQMGGTSKQGQFQRLLGERVRTAGFGLAELVSTNLNVVARTSRMGPRPGTQVAEGHVDRYRELFSSGKTVLITPFKAPPPRGPGGGGPGPRRFGWMDWRGPRAFADRPPPEEMPPFGEPPPDRGPMGPMGPPGTNTFEPTRPELSLMQVVAPVRNNDGVVVGALACVVRPEEEFTRVLSVARPGQSGETFAFDPAGMLISQSRFDDQLRAVGLLASSSNITSSLNVMLRNPGKDLTKGDPIEPGSLTNKPLMTMVADALAGGGGVDIAETRDYRGIPVVGAWRWLPDLNFGVLTKIDAAEAFQPLRVLRLIFAFLLGLLALITVVTLMVAYLNVTWRRRFNEAQLKARQLGQYTLEEKIGEGGMGIVYRARHALLRRETAVKLLLPDRADADLVKQFEHEVRLTCQLTHPNTIQIYDYGRTADDIFYYAMELLRGLTLQDLVERHGSQPEARVRHLLMQVCGSLHEAHTCGLIHRDIKPGNLFLCERGGVSDVVKVLDFGLVGRMGPHGHAGATRHDGPDTTRFLGTPHYMAPEVIRQPGFGDARSDIYALGAVGYLLLTGELVFDGEEPDKVWQKHLDIEPVPPSARSTKDITPAFERLILRCLAKDPLQRPQSIAELADALLTCTIPGSWGLENGRVWWERHGATTAPNGKPSRPVSTAGATIRINVSGRNGS